MDKSIREFINEVMRHNGYISGRFAANDGDIMAILNYREDFSKYSEAKTLMDLYHYCKSSMGTFVWRNIVIFNHPYDFGTFVYKMPNAEECVEHLDVDAMPFERFAEIIEKLASEN